MGISWEIVGGHVVKRAGSGCRTTPDRHAVRQGRKRGDGTDSVVTRNAAGSRR